jgi:hypothetical protein
VAAGDSAADAWSSPVGSGSLLGPVLGLRDGFFVLALLLLATLWWLPQNRSPHALVDEVSYFRAADLIQQDRSPFEEPSYLYPPPLAIGLAAIENRLGPQPTRLLLRHLDLALGCLGVWIALRLLPWSWRSLFPLALVYLCFAPPFATDVVRGNLSASATGLTMLALALPLRAPSSAVGGALLGAGLVIKPMALLVPEALLLHGVRPARSRERLAALLTGGLSVVTVLLLLLIGRELLPALLTQAGGLPDAARVTSLHRLLWRLGLPLPTGAVVTLCAAAVAPLVWYCRRRPAARGAVPIALAGSLLALPVTWPHSYLLALPLQTATLALWLDRRRRGVAHVWELLVLALGASLLFSDGLGAIEHPAWLNLTLTAMPTLAPAALAAYLVAASDPSQGNLPGSTS